MCNSTAYLGVYKEFLLNNQITDAKHVDFFVNWVKSFLRGYGAHPTVISDQDIRSHLLYRTKLNRHQPWQLEQCEYAIKVYAKDFLPLLIQGNIDELKNKPCSIVTAKSSWEDVLLLVEQRIKMRHYAQSTCKSYIGWLKRFREFVAPLQPSELTSDPVQHFLSHLSMQKKVAASTQNQAFNAILFLFREILH